MGRRLCAVGVCLGTVTLSASAFGVTYKVGPSETHQQLSQVAGLLNPGDVVELEGDHTYDGGVVFSRNGSASQKIRIVGVPKNGKRPIVSGAVNTIEAAGDHYVFEGLELTGGSFRCFYHHAHDITLRDSVVRDCAKHGVLGADQDSGSLLMEYVEVYGCGGGTQDHQVYMATDETAHPGSVFRMQFCYVHSANGGNNVKSRAERNEIYYNWIEGAQYHELELIGPDGQNPALAREDSDVVGNVLVKTETSYVVRFGGDGTGETYGRYRFVNNTVVVQPGGSAVFRLFHGIESLEAHNNAFWMNGSGAMKLVRTVEAVFSSGSPKLSGQNNYLPPGATDVPTEWTASVAGPEPGFASLASWDLSPNGTSVLIDAGASALSAPAGYDFPSPLAVPGYHPPPRTLLAPGSAIVRPVNGAIDVGAFESGPPAMGTGGSSGAGGSGGSAAGGSAGSAAGGSAGSAAGGSSSGGTGAQGAGGSGATAGGGAASGDDDGGCGCRAITGDGSTHRLAWFSALVGLVALRRRRRATL